MTSGAEVGDLSTKVPLGSHGACMVMGGYTGWGGPKKALNKIYLDLPRGAEWMIRGAEKHHSLGFKQHTLEEAGSLFGKDSIDF